MNLGDIVDGYCSSCKLNLDVSVAAVVDGEAKQVQCRTCGNFVSYKPPVDMQKKKEAALKKLMRMQAKTRGKSGEVKAIDPGTLSIQTERWKTLTDKVMSWQAKPYDAHRTYAQGNFILHKPGGMGHVESADEKELIVLFKSGLMTVAHGVLREE